MRKFKYDKKTFQFSTEVTALFEKRITKFGNGAKLDAPKKHIGKRAYAIIVDD